MEKHQIIICTDDDTIARRATLAIWQPEVDIHRVPLGDALLDLLDREPIAVMISDCPRKPSELGRMVDAVRHHGAHSRRVGFVVIAQPEEVEAAVGFVGRGINWVVRVDRIAEDLKGAVSELIHVAPRFRVEAPATIRPTRGLLVQAAPCRLENVSSSGMLLCCRRLIPNGTLVDFEIALAEEAIPIRGEARVCRSTSTTREVCAGIGARFTAFAGGDLERLEGLLARQAS